MKPTDRQSGPRRILTALVALAVAGVATTGCVYRPTIQQGNLLLQSDIDQIKPGMTRSQVRYILGTPMVSDPFEPNRWDYVYTLQQGRSKHVDRAHIVVYFDGDKVTRVANLEAPLEDSTQKIIRQQREAAAKASQAPAAGTPASPAASPAPGAQSPAVPPAEKPPGGG